MTTQHEKKMKALTRFAAALTLALAASGAAADSDLPNWLTCSPSLYSNGRLVEATISLGHPGHVLSGDSGWVYFRQVIWRPDGQMEPKWSPWYRYNLGNTIPWVDIYDPASGWTMDIAGGHFTVGGPGNYYAGTYYYRWYSGYGWYGPYWFWPTNGQYCSFSNLY